MKLLVKLYLSELLKGTISIEDVPTKLRDEVEIEYEKSIAVSDAKNI